MDTDGTGRVDGGGAMSTFGGIFYYWREMGLMPMTLNSYSARTVALSGLPAVRTARPIPLP